MLKFYFQNGNVNQNIPTTSSYAETSGKSIRTLALKVPASENVYHVDHFNITMRTDENGRKMSYLSEISYNVPCHK